MLLFLLGEGVIACRHWNLLGCQSGQAILIPLLHLVSPQHVFKFDSSHIRADVRMEQFALQFLHHRQNLVRVDLLVPIQVGNSVDGSDFVCFTRATNDSLGATNTLGSVAKATRVGRKQQESRKTGHRSAQKTGSIWGHSSPQNPLSILLAQLGFYRNSFMGRKKVFGRDLALFFSCSKGFCQSCRETTLRHCTGRELCTMEVYRVWNASHDVAVAAERVLSVGVRREVR